jgi:hypothetical protein
MRTAVSAVLFAVFVNVVPSPTTARCHPIEVKSWSPTGIAGCPVYGVGWASWWSGPGVARNDCLWPWTRCQSIRITALDTSISVVVRPTMWCDCFVKTGNARSVDLDPATLKALGLWKIRGQGLFKVTVEPVSDDLMLPDTALR